MVVVCTLRIKLRNRSQMFWKLDGIIHSKGIVFLRQNMAVMTFWPIARFPDVLGRPSFAQHFHTFA